MTKRITSKFKVCKKIQGVYKNLWGTQKAVFFRSIKVFKQNAFTVKQKKNRLTTFGRYLNTKQIIKNFYCNISEQRLQTYINASITSKTTSIKKLFSLLESRVDTILFRACLVNSLYMARQLINHRLIVLNNHYLCYSAVKAKQNDIFSLNPHKAYLSNLLIKILKRRRFRKYFLISLKVLKKTNISFLKFNFQFLNLKNRKLTTLIKKISLKKFNIILNLKNMKLIEMIPTHLEVNFKIFKVVFLWDPIFQKLYYPVKINYKKHEKSNLISLNNIFYRY